MTQIINKFQQVMAAAKQGRQEIEAHAVEVHRAWTARREAWIAQLHRSNGRVNFVRQTPAWGNV